ELRLDFLDSSWIGFQRGQKRAQRACRLPQPHLRVVQLLGCARELGVESPGPRDRYCCGCGERGGTVAVLRVERLYTGWGCFAAPRDVAAPLALGSRPPLEAGPQAAGTPDEGAPLGEPRLGGRAVTPDLLVPPPGDGELTPGGAELSAAIDLLLARER